MVSPPPLIFTLLSNSSSAIVPIAMPGTHQRFLPFFLDQASPVGSRVLDIGAGHGAFAKRLYDLGYQVDA